MRQAHRSQGDIGVRYPERRRAKARQQSHEIAKRGRMGAGHHGERARRQRRSVRHPCQHVVGMAPIDDVGRNDEIISCRDAIRQRPGIRWQAGAIAHPRRPFQPVAEPGQGTGRNGRRCKRTKKLDCLASLGKRPARRASFNRFHDVMCSSRATIARIDGWQSHDDRTSPILKLATFAIMLACIDDAPRSDRHAKLFPVTAR